MAGVDIYADVNKGLTDRNYTRALIFDTFYEYEKGWFYTNDFVKLTKGDVIHALLIYESPYGRNIFYRRMYKIEVSKFNNIEEDRWRYAGGKFAANRSSGFTALL